MWTCLCLLTYQATTGKEICGYLTSFVQHWNLYLCVKVIFSLIHILLGSLTSGIGACYIREKPGLIITTQTFRLRWFLVNFSVFSQSIMPKNNPSSVEFNTSTMVSNDEKILTGKFRHFSPSNNSVWIGRWNRTFRKCVRRSIWICKLEYCGEYLAPLTIKLLIWR